MDKIMKVKDLNFYFREDAKIINNLNLSISRGEYIGIAGHNGSGKSTLAKILCGILEPISGEVTIRLNEKDEKEAILNIEDPSKFYEVKKNIGMIFQNPDDQLIASTIRKEIAFGPENIGMSPKTIKQIVEEVSEKLELTEFLEKNPNELSGGQKQRVAIASILAMNPNIIIFDEATAMLDPLGRKEVMDIIKSIHKMGVTVINITHFMEELLEADRIIVMDKGNIVLEDTANNIFNQEEKIQELGLEIPNIIKLRNQLNKNMPNKISGKIIDLKEMVDIICQSR